MLQLYSQAFGLSGVVFLDDTVTCPPQSYAGFVVTEECEIGAIDSDFVSSAGAAGAADPDHWFVGCILPVGFQFWVPFQSLTILSGRVAMYKQDKTFKAFTR